MYQIINTKSREHAEFGGPGSHEASATSDFTVGASIGVHVGACVLATVIVDARRRQCYCLDDRSI
jgi:hypothetical protein